MDLLKELTSFIEQYLKSKIYINALMLSKFVAIMFIIANVFTQYFHHRIDHTKEGAFRWSDLTKPFIYIFFIVFFNTFLTYLEIIASSFFTPLENMNTIHLNLFKQGAKVLYHQELEEETKWFELGRVIKEAIMSQINICLAYLIGALDLVIYASFIAERYFLLGVANLLFPFLLAFSALNKFEDYIIRGIKAYLAIILMLFIIHAGEGVGTGIYEVIYGKLVDEKDLKIGKEQGNIMTFFYMIIASIIGVLIKLKLIKSGLSYLFRIVA